MPNHALSQASVVGVVGGTLMETRGKAGKREKGPAPSWLGFQQVASQQEVGASKGGAESDERTMGRVKGTMGGVEGGRAAAGSHSPPATHSLQGQEVAKVCGALVLGTGGGGKLPQLWLGREEQGSGRLGPPFPL